VAKWEYAMMDIQVYTQERYKLADKQLDAAGAKGWELVTTLTIDGSTAKLIFKKPLE
jgi:hypothetical protein